LDNRILVDTDILIDTARGVDEAIEYLANTETRTNLSISVVTQLMLIVGCQSKAELRSLETFLLRFEIFNLNDQISMLAVELLGKYRLSHGLLIADALMAAKAISFDLPFITKNQKDYRFISDLRLIAYP
jgi:predicted nucleic acid-binding protein